ncbi:hypothetical protein B0T16DRAFT_245812 [Cercophora newfieldiana]|uniref:Uncharacterized protein n=1 Tax=Cercophora newfieldiana TaxID=92897 RepID=A0AA40CIG3_9PEZI|nr:hypothetical protein B0T16DRAFT_245812 [Cercophora newfieldiana]
MTDDLTDGSLVPCYPPTRSPTVPGPIHATQYTAFDNGPCRCQPVLTRARSQSTARHPSRAVLATGKRS